MYRPRYGPPMTLQPWPEHGNERLAKFKVFDLRVAERTNPRTGIRTGMFHIDTPHWVNVVAWTVDEELLLVRQYRHGTCDFSLEIPGGLIDPTDRDPAAAARRELEEETGYRAGDLVEVGQMTPNPALFTNRCWTFLATGCTADGAMAQDPGEDIEVVRMPAAEVRDAVCRGEIHHALVLAGLLFAEMSDRPAPGLR